MTKQKWFVGVDWATEEHAVCLVDDQGEVVGERTVPHTGTGISEMCTWLLEKAGTEDASALHVAIEVPRGPVVETMLERGMVVHAINPKQAAYFRKRYSAAGAKDDRRDARMLARALRTDRACFRALRVDEPTVIELREWSRIADDLQAERTRLSNRLRQQLLRYYPQILELAVDIAHESFLGLWALAPTPADAAVLREKKLAKYLADARIRRIDAAEALSTLRQKPLTVAPGTTEAAKAHIASLSERIRLINRQLKEAHQRLDALTDAVVAEESEPGQKGEQRDVDILRSLPGVGRIVLATLLAEAAQPLAAGDYRALRTLCGVAPVTEGSGKKSKDKARVVMRQACSRRLRNAVHYWASSAAQHDPKSRADYAALRKRGKTHGRAIRGVADRLLAVACAMLRNRTLFDGTRRMAA